MHRRNRTTQRACLVLLLLALFCEVPADDLSEAYNWRHPNEVTVTPDEMAFTSEYIGETKNESAFVWAISPDGSLVHYSVFHIDSLLFDRWGMYALVVDPEGESHWYTTIPKGRDIRFSESNLSISAGDIHLYTDLSTTPITSRLVGGFDGFGCDITFVSRLPPWKPGTGRLDYNDKGSLYQMRILIAPWTYATGTVSVDGREFAISGDGYVAKTRFSNPLTRFPQVLHAFKLHSEDEFLLILDVTLHEAYGSEPVPMLAFARDDTWLLTTQDYRITTLETIKSGKFRHEVPKRLHISYEDDEISLDGVFTAERLINITDVFDEIPGFVRDILSVFLRRPVYYRFMGTFEGTSVDAEGNVHQLKLTGPYEYTVVR